MLRCILLLFASLNVLPCLAGVLVPQDCTWRFFKGYSEASTPDASAWRQLGFEDSAWATSRAAFFYENNPGGTTAYAGNTILTDMFGHYTCLFLRQTFVVTNINDIAALQIAALSDDGFIAWINGQEVGRFNMPAGDVPHNGTASPALPEPIPWWTNTVSDIQSLLVPGANVLAVQAFNSSIGSSSDFIINPALYYIPDLTSPILTLIYPATNSAVRQLTSIEVAFSEPVAGVDASDLLIDGQPATDLVTVTPSQFVFSFSQPATGTVQVAWAPGHGIHDLSSASNTLGGGNWSYTLDTNAPPQGVMISEFMAANGGNQTNSLHDELGNSPDWIELYNSGNTPVSLTGWSLTDDATKPAKWVFPATMLSANSYLVVFASGRNTNVNGRLHTSFKLSSSPGYLGLFDPAGNVISAFSPTCPQQYTDISYGRDRLDPTLLGYFTNSTPGAANSTTGPGFGPDVQFSRAGGTFLSSFSLTLTTTDINSDIRYVLVTTNLAYGTAAITNIPITTSPLYTAPIQITKTAQVRARAFPRQAGFWPGQPHTESYINLSPAAATFTSDLPVMLLHNLAGGPLSASASSQNQSVIVMLFEPVNGRTSLTNPPTLVTRAGFNIRGRSTAGSPQYNLALEIWDEYNQDNEVDFLGLPAESDWVLYAQDYYDTSYLHNPLIHQLCRDSGRYSSRTRFAEMFLNTGGGPINYSSPVGGNYFGLYTVEEKIKRGKDRVDIEKLEPQVTNALAITGGYMLKIDSADSNERTFYDSYLQGDIVYVDPPGLEMVDVSRQAQASYIGGYFSQFGAALWSASYTNPVIGYAAYIDVESWLDHHIFNVLAYNLDAFRLSGYFFKDRDKRIEMGPLWDFDRSLGTYNPSFDSWDNRCFNPRLWHVQSSGDEGTDYFGAIYPDPVRWWQRLFTDPDFWQRWIDRWTDLRRDVLSTNHVFAVIDGFANQLTQARPREARRWTYNAPRSGTRSANGYSYSFPGTYQGEIDFLKKWLVDRVDFLDTNFLRAPVFSSNGGAITSGFPLTITAPTVESNTTKYYTLNGTDPRLAGGAISPDAISNSGTINLSLTNNARVFARNFNLGHSNVTGGAVGGNPPLSSPWSGSTISTFVVATPTLAITEIMHHPVASGTNDAEDFEFIELKNLGAQPLNLIGISFTNGISFTFTATNAITNLGPGQYVVLVANTAAFLSRYPTITNIGGQYTGRLDPSGERLYLEGTLKEPILDFTYNDSWYPTTDGGGFSLVIRNEYASFNTWTNPASWRPSTALNGSPGRADTEPPVIPAVVINEALAHTDPPQSDTIELYNPTASPAAIGGWFLSDNHDKPTKYCIPANTFIPPGGYVNFSESQFNNNGSNSFALSSLGEEVYLFSGDGTNITGYRHGFEFGAQVNGVSFGRNVTSNGIEHFVTQKVNTLGTANAGPKVGPVVINEIMYAPPPFGSDADNLDEYIELRNITGQSAPLFDPLYPTNTWQFRGAVRFTFPLGVTMAPWSYLLVVSFDPAHDPVMLDWFRNRYGEATNTPIFGPWTGHLDNAGERVALYMPDKPELPPSSDAGFVPQVLVEEVNYSPLPPWSVGADSNGNSLQRIAGAAFADDPANWQAAAPTAGQLNQGAITVDTDHDGLPDEWELANRLDPLDPTGINSSLGDTDGDGMTNWQEYQAGTDPQNSQDALRFDHVSCSNLVCLLEFKTHTGRTYAIERLNAFGPISTWVAFTNFIPGTSGTVTVSDPQTTAGYFYRLKVTPEGQDTPWFDHVSCSNFICLLQFNTYSGRTYAIERLSALGPTNAWVAFTNFIPGTSGPVTVSAQQTTTSQFYRLKVTRN
jgi:hypothetical protein